MVNEPIFSRKFVTDLYGRHITVFSNITSLPFAENEKFVQYIFTLIKRLNPQSILNEDNNITLSIINIYQKLPDNFLVTYSLTSKKGSAKQIFINPTTHKYTLVKGAFDYSQ